MGEAYSNTIIIWTTFQETKHRFFPNEQDGCYLKMGGCSSVDICLKYFFPYRVVKEEISDDNAKLPCFNGRVVSWVSKFPILSLVWPYTYVCLFSTMSLSVSLLLPLFLLSLFVSLFLSLSASPSFLLPPCGFSGDNSECRILQAFFLQECQRAYYQTDKYCMYSLWRLLTRRLLSISTLD